VMPTAMRVKTLLICHNIRTCCCVLH
jgi:hypothetical protein